MKSERTARTVVVASIMCVVLGGCGRRTGENPSSGHGASRPAYGSRSIPGSDKPGWLDLYRKKSVVNVATVDHVVIVTFETLGPRDEVFGHYTGEFEREENFISFRDNRDIISFLRDGYGVKITLLDPTRNLWSLEYHKQAI
jgi:hypothetical protein